MRMSMTGKTVAILTGGGDCPGLNAVIRAVVQGALRANCRIYGIEDGFGGLVGGRMRLLTEDDVANILAQGGTILGTTNRDNPFHCPVNTKDGVIFEDRHEMAVANLKERNIELLFVVGGDGSLKIASEMANVGVKVISIPKTIDNDIAGTERTFGFDTAMSVAAEALDRLRTTADSHHRVMVLEVMGRYAGWIALHSGIAGGADCILIPEIPFDKQTVLDKIKEREAAGYKSSVVVVAEGAKEIGGELTVARIVPDSFEQIRLGGIGNKVAQMIEDSLKIESRCTVLGYLQRGGTPTAYDRVLSTRYGVAAFEAYMRGEYNVLVALKDNHIITVPVSKVADVPSLVPVEGELVRFARQIGICFG